MRGRHGAIAERPEERRLVGMTADDPIVDEARDLPRVKPDRLSQWDDGDRLRTLRFRQDTFQEVGLFPMPRGDGLLGRGRFLIARGSGILPVHRISIKLDGSAQDAIDAGRPTQQISASELNFPVSGERDTRVAALKDDLLLSGK